MAGETEKARPHWLFEPTGKIVIVKRAVKRIVLLQLLALLAGDAWAGRWVPIVDGVNRAVYLDTAGAVREGAVVRTWVREVFAQEQRSDQVGVYYYSANSLVSYDCRTRTFVPLYRVFYGVDGTELRRINLDAVEAPALVPPGSMHEGLLDRACLPGKPKGEAARGTPVQVALAETSPKATAVSASAERDGAADTEPPKPRAEATKQPAAGGKSSAEDGVPKDRPHAMEGVVTKPGAKPSAEVREPTARSAARPLGKPPAHLAVNRERPVRTAKPRSVAVAEQAEAPPAIHWSYEGPGAPDKWSKLNVEYESCAAGKRQSPIDIRDGARLELEPIRFDYKPAPLRMIDNGHTVQVNYAEGSSILVAGERFELKQLHFHKPAEERIEGRAFDMVAHLVHQSLDGRLAVVAVLFVAGDQPNAFIDGLWPHLPLEPNREVAPLEVTVDVNALLPESRSYYAYMGSLTTPPCTEGVLWLVLKTPVKVSREQVGVFGRLYAMNARPVQPANGRLIKESN
jgi:carbonic anhydrase